MLRAAGDWQRAKDVDVKKFQGSLEAGNRVIQRSIETDNSARSVRRLGLIHDVAWHTTAVGTPWYLLSLRNWDASVTQLICEKRRTCCKEIEGVKSKSLLILLIDYR